MEKMTAAENRILNKAREIGAAFTPTQLGVMLGYAQTRASSRVAPQLRALTEAGFLEKTGQHKLTRYALTASGMGKVAS